ncbi:MAG: oligopeptide/dipeptide ABC transporter ATP-binding protein, partial [Ilumatobacteraceae bacterium]
MSDNGSSSLTIRGLRIEVADSGNDIVDGVDLVIRRGEVLGLVGESGSGKTTVGLSVLGHGRRGVRLSGGAVTVGSTSMLELDEDDLREARGTLVSYVPQDPSTALNPALRIETQIMEVMEFHGFGESDEARRARAVEVMSEVLLPGTPAFMSRYPHQLSGGQQQRVGLAMAFACRPSVIVLDEPTTGLDVSTQSHVLATVRDLTRTHGVAALYVTHDLAVVANLADRVAVMYAGRVVEEGPTRSIFTDPQHPYTRYLTAAAPDIKSDRPIVGLSGRAPSPGQRPAGCAFALRCELATAECSAAFPPVVSVSDGHTVRCIRHGQVPERTRASGRIVARPADAATVLSVRGLSASYTRHQVVHDVSFDIRRSECVALVGESGSGKSTLSR